MAVLGPQKQWIGHAQQKKEAYCTYSFRTVIHHPSAVFANETGLTSQVAIQIPKIFSLTLQTSLLHAFPKVLRSGHQRVDIMRLSRRKSNHISKTGENLLHRKAQACATWRACGNRCYLVHRPRNPWNHRYLKGSFKTFPTPANASLPHGLSETFSARAWSSNLGRTASEPLIGTSKWCQKLSVPTSFRLFEPAWKLHS